MIFFDACFDIAHGFPLGVVNESAILAAKEIPRQQPAVRMNRR